MSERSACAEVGISRSTFRTTALRVNSGDHYARALEALAQDQVEKAEQVIEDMRSGVIDAQQARVELDARKWFASKFLPKRYGDKVHLEANVTTRNADELPDDELARIARSGRE